MELCVFARTGRWDELFLIFNSSTNSYFPLQTERYLGLSFPSVDAQRAYEEFAHADEH